MPIIVSDSVKNKGKQDAKRHRDKQKEIIKKQLPDIIADESIITHKKGKIVKVPIKSLQNERFRQGKRQSSDGDGEGEGQGGGGIGQGPGKPGDIIGRRPADGEGKEGGKRAGEEPGVDYVETEMDIEEIIEMVFEDLGLPNLEQKDIKELEVMLGFKIEDIVRGGPWPLMNRPRSAKEGIRRFYHYLNYLKNETKKDELACFSALKQADGNLADAESLLADKAFIVTETEIQPFAIIESADLRFWKVEQDITLESNAVIFAMMDVSGSMTTEKKYLVRSLLFWLVEFLRKIHEHVDVRFITHHTQARLVDEDDFFHVGESGGTWCWTAFDLASSVMEAEYPAVAWNRYVFYFSDGEDFYFDRTIEEIQRIVENGVSMVAYGEIDLEAVRVNEYHLYYHLKATLPVIELEPDENDNMYVLVGTKKFPFLGVTITGKEDILPAIRQFLHKWRFQ